MQNTELLVRHHSDGSRACGAKPKVAILVLKPAVYIAVNGIKMRFRYGEVKLGAFGGIYFYSPKLAASCSVGVVALAVTSLAAFSGGWFCPLQELMKMDSSMSMYSLWWCGIVSEM